MENEVWKDIEGYEGLYQISNLGRVKSFKNNRWGIGEGNILKNQKRSQGYLGVGLYKNSIVKLVRINRLVAQAFIPNPENKPQVNHKKGIKADNRASELEWCTHGENQKHSYDFLGRSKIRPKWNLNTYEKKSKKVNQYNLEGKLIKKWNMIRNVERELNFCQSTISRCCRGKGKTAYGFIWKYA